MTGIDDMLTGLFDGAPLLVALGIAFLLGARHATDPDHLVAVTSLVAADDGDTRRAASLGAWWGVGHATSLLALGIPLIAFKAQLPAWLENGAEKAIGVVILVLAARVVFKWARGDYRAAHTATSTGTHSGDTYAEVAVVTATCASEAAARRRRSACCTASPAPAPWSFC